MDTQNRPRRRLFHGPRIALIAGLAAAASFSYAAVAQALTETYGGYSICGSNCYIQAPLPAHTYVYNRGSIQDSAYVACQLFNNSGYNNVRHGYGLCSNDAPSLPYKFARVYNQSYLYRGDSATRVTSGTANT